jgi:hypothetical protein
MNKTSKIIIQESQKHFLHISQRAAAWDFLTNPQTLSLSQQSSALAISLEAYQIS